MTTTDQGDDGRTSPEGQRVGHTYAHTRARVLQIVEDVNGKVRRLPSVDPWTGRPPSLKSVCDYTRAGGWVPGERSWQVELPGKFYGYCVAIPVLAVLYAVSFVLARPSRLLIVALVALLLWLTL